ncbi:MAG: insulinase family protein [Treponema sp.]|jgi:zinc protease|nr:insulinase family protein [Treponema sp.]
MNIFNSKHRAFAFALALSLFLPGFFLSCLSTTKPEGPSIASYSGLGAPADPIPFMKKVRTGVLPGGLRYFILENPRPENRAFLTLAVDAGSVLEEDNEQGLAHFVEHMAFNGTARFPESELIGYLRSLGMRFGPEVNAYTSYDRTVFGIEVPVEQAKTASGGPLKRLPVKALEVLDDWTRAITFAPKDVDEERLVIMEEYRAHLGAVDRLQRKLLPILFGGSRYESRFPIGLPEIIENAPAQRLEAFYRRWYRPDNMALIIVGDFDGASLEAELGSHFGGAAAEGPLARPRYDLPAPKKGNLETAILTDPEISFSQINLYFKRNPQPLGQDLKSYREGLIDNLISRMLSLRFADAAQDPESPYIYGGAGNVRYGASARYYVLMAEPKSGKAEESLRELVRVKESMRRFGFTETEIRIAKASLLSELEQAVSEKDRQPSDGYVSGLTDYFLDGEPLPDIEWEYAAALQLLPGIGAVDITRQAGDYFEPGDVRAFIIAPESERGTLPAEAMIRRIIRESAGLRLQPPEEPATAEALVSRRPEAGSVRSESVDGETGALVWELENGATLILKETANRNNDITLYAMARGGTVSVESGDRVSALLAAEMAEASGLGPWPRPQLIKLLADKQVSFSFWTGNYNRGFQGSATAKDIETLFEMLYLSFTQPRLDGNAVRALLDSYRTSLIQRNEDPGTVFSDAVVSVSSGGHPYFKPLTAEDLDKADLARALSFIKRGLNPGDYTFVFAGNLDPALMRSLAETWLASIPASEPWNAWTDPGLQRPGKTDTKVYKGKEEQSIVYLGWFAPLAYSEEQSAAVSVLMEYLDIRLTEDIREKMGGVYSVQADLSLSPVPVEELVAQVYFVCDPKRSDELSQAVEALLRRTAEEPVSRDVFAKSVEALKKNWEASIQSNLYIAQSYANSSVLLRSPLSRLDSRPELYSRVQPEDIQRLCRLLISRGPARVLLYPEGWN